MAVLLTKTMGQLNEERKPVYPLFEKPSKGMTTAKKNLETIQQVIATPSVSEAVLQKVQKSKKPKKPTDDDLIAPSSLLTVVLQADHAELLDVDPNSSRRKRRKPTPVQNEVEIIREVATVDKSVIVNDITTLDNITIESRQGDELMKSYYPQEKSCASVGIANSLESNESQKPIDLENTTIGNGEYGTETPVEVKPKKILRFNPKTGTIGSPPAKRDVAESDPANKPRLKSRAKQPTSKVVTIRCSQEIGVQIDHILSGSQRINISKDIPKVSKGSTIDPPKSMEIANTGPTKPSTALHPFFSGKPPLKPLKDTAKTNPEILEPQDQKDTRALGRARPKSREGLLYPSKPSSTAFTGYPGFGNTAKLVKFPGAIEPAWPWKGMIHVRGIDCNEDETRASSEDSFDLRSKVKKSKYHAVEVLAQEGIIGTLATDLCIDEVVKSIKEINMDEFPPLPHCLRAPMRHFETGPDLQKRVQLELHAQLAQLNVANDSSSSEDEIQTIGPNRGAVHPALSKVYNSIATSLSAFDRFQCETQSWIHKYSPQSAAETLQTGKEAIILKEWLQKSTVMSVETGSSDRPNSRSSSVVRRSAASKPDPPGKRKRKSKKLDGFVVSSDEENNDLDEISEPDEDASPRSNQGLLKKTVVRAGDSAAKGSKDAGRFANAVVISGPHGSGKTAAVYAVAKELGFEVFEINSSSRRSGKDILEKVGDMTRNHLVQRSHNQTPADPVDEDAQRISDALAKDIKSGRQGTMNSFFRAKGSTKLSSKPPPTKAQPAAKVTEHVQACLNSKTPLKQQKQSLILFEEVDILYEEDKQFWATVMNLIIQSKRPIIMTCHDESVVPIQALSLHAILRFTPPPVELAADYLLLVAANEGHALQRDAVKTLYESRNFDLRASIMDLNFWCQFAIGDIKGGLSWFYPRWPLGSDIDKHGNTIRVVSERTYERGMGWLSQDFIEGNLDYLDIEEETLRETLDRWHLDMGDWQQTIDVTGWANKAKALTIKNSDSLSFLGMYDDFADAMSVADLCSGSAFASDDQIQLDITIPELSDKVREDYTVYHQLLETTPLVPFDTTGSDIALWMQSRSRKYLQVDQHIKHGFEVPSELDRPTEAHIISLIRDSISTPKVALAWPDLSLAFDPISEPEKKLFPLSTEKWLEASVFDRTKTLIVLDIAPYIRSIVSYDARLQEERTRMSNLLSKGGRKGKRLRTTRAAISALEGGARSTTRRDKYFGSNLNPYHVLKTGMPCWLEAVSTQMDEARDTTLRSDRGDTDRSKMETDVEQDEPLENRP